MKTLRELIPMMNATIEKILFLRGVPKEDFINIYYGDENLYDDLHNSKVGLIRIKKIPNGKTEYGFTAAFGEGVICYMSNEDRWYRTSVIEHINKDTFETLNSIYEYQFQEIPWDKLYADLQLYTQLFELDEGKN